MSSELWPWKPNPKVVYAGRGMSQRQPTFKKGIAIPKRSKPFSVHTPSQLSDYLKDKLYNIPKRNEKEKERILGYLKRYSQNELRELVLWWAGFDPSIDIQDVLLCTMKGLREVVSPDKEFWSDNIIAKTINTDVRSMYPKLNTVINNIVKNEKTYSLMLDISKLYTNSSKLDYQEELLFSEKIAKKHMSFINKNTKLYVHFGTFGNIPLLLSELISPKNIKFDQTLKRIYDNDIPKYDVKAASKQIYLIGGPTFTSDDSEFHNEEGIIKEDAYFCYKFYYRNTTIYFREVMNMMVDAINNIKKGRAILIVEYEDKMSEQIINETDRDLEYISQHKSFSDIDILLISDVDDDRELYKIRKDFSIIKLKEKYGNDIFIFQVERDFIGSGKEHTTRFYQLYHPIKSFNYTDILNSPLFSTSLLDPGNWIVC